MSPDRKQLRRIGRLCLAGALWLLAAAQAPAAVEVRAGLEQNPPLSFLDDQGQPAGILVDLLDHVAAQEGWRLTYVPDTFNRCLEKLQDGDIDLMVTIAYSRERAELFDFNRTSVIANWGVLYAAPGHAIQTYFDLEGKRVGVMAMDIHHQAFRTLAEKFGVQVEFVSFDNFDLVFRALRERRVDAGVVGRFYGLRHEESFQLQPTPIIFNPIAVHYATGKGANGELLLALDRHLEQLKADRTSLYYQSLERWLGVLSRRSLPRWLLLALGGGGAGLVLLAFFNLALRRRVRSRTRHLELEMAERARAQKALLASEAKYRDLVEHANAIILCWDPSGRVTFLNEFGQQFFGYGEAEIVGRSVMGTIVPEVESDGRDLAEMIQALCRHPEEFVVNENENLRKSGERVWVSWRNRPVYDEGGSLTGILSVGQDVTEKKQAETALLALDRAKNDFISTAAHELRTPLASIMGYAELLRDAGTAGAFPSAQTGEFLGEICAKADKLSRIVDDLLDISRIQQGLALPLEKRPASLCGLVDQVVRQFQVLHRHRRFRVEGRPGLPLEVPFDHDRLSQVLENLLGNAVKYSAAGTEIVVGLSPGEGEVWVTVADQGVGMTPEQVARVFDRFYRANAGDTAVGGLGLGMSIARHLVEAHGGRIWVESTPGAGTRVSFTVPC